MVFMARKSTPAPPREVIEIAHRLGERIRAARIRRKWRQEELVQRTGLSRTTIKAIERGDPRTQFGSYLQVLWMLGLTNEVELIADPGLDREGLTLALDVAKKRVYIPTKVDDEF